MSMNPTSDAQQNAFGNNTQRTQPAASQMMRYGIGESNFVYEAYKSTFAEFGEMNGERLRKMMTHDWARIEETNGKSLAVRFYIPAGSMFGNETDQVKFMGFITKKDPGSKDDPGLSEDDVPELMELLHDYDDVVLDRLIEGGELARANLF